LTRLINVSFRLKCTPEVWKIGEVIMISKPGKPLNEVASHRPISLLPVASKLFEKLLLKILKIIIERKHVVPTHQFAFREEHSTIEQVHELAYIVENTIEGKKICATIFLDLKQAFDKVWHKELMTKLHKLLPKQYCQILESYISGRLFRIKQGNKYSNLKEIKAGVPQGNVLLSVLYLLYTYDVPQTVNTKIATFADDAAVMAVGENIEEATQQAINAVNSWTKQWRIILNEIKSVHVNFTHRKVGYIQVTTSINLIPCANMAKYLGMTLHAKQQWKEHVKKRIEELNIKYRKV
jgi:hypothetical protein